MAPKRSGTKIFIHYSNTINLLLFALYAKFIVNDSKHTEYVYSVARNKGYAGGTFSATKRLTLKNFRFRIHIL